MKKISYFLLLIVLFIPLLVNAEACDNDKVSISSITIENKSDNVEEINDANVQGKNVSLNLNMSNVGDNIKYRIIVKNDSNKDYLLNKNSIKVSSNYIDYNIESSDNSNIVKAKTAKAFYLNVLYKNGVPDNLFENGSINDNVTMKLNLSSDNIQNPNTGIMYYVFIAFVITIMIIMLFAFKKKRKNNRFEFLVIGLFLLIPIGVKALCNVDININSNIKIDKPIVCGSFENDSWSAISYNVRNSNDSCYNVGDTKEVELEGFGTHIVRIANKSTPDECNQDDFSQTACGFVVEFADILTKEKMSLTITNEGGWGSTNLRLYLNNDIYNILPVELKKRIIDTKVVSGLRYNDTNSFTTIDKLYILSGKEIWGKVGSAFLNEYDRAWNNTKQLDYYSKMNVTTSNYFGAVKKFNNNNSLWWLRTALYNNDDDFWIVSSQGDFSTSTPTDICGVSPAFRIG